MTGARNPMPQSKPDTQRDCIVVGGGIGGAVLALVLGKAGKRVAILEKEISPPRIGRPEVLALATFHVFDRLGVGDRIRREAAMPLQGREIFISDGTLLHRFESQDFRDEKVQPYSVLPGKIREILLEEALRIPGVDLFRGEEVKTVIRKKGRVAGVVSDQREWRASLVAGDDGARSRIREALGLHVRTQTFPLGFLTASGLLIPGGKPAWGQIWLRPQALREKKKIFAVFFVPQPGPATAVVFLMTHEAWQFFRAQPPDIFYQEARRVSPRAENLSSFLSFPEDFFYHERPFGHANRYVEEGAALLGDAAHPVTPVGGQGANMAIADAVALGARALEAFAQNDFSAEFLSVYEKIRRPANARSLRFSRAAWFLMHCFLRAPGAANFLIPALIRALDKNLFLRSRFIQGVSHAFEA